MKCDLTNGPVIVADHILQCNGLTLPFPHNSTLHIIGSTSRHFVSLTNTALSVHLSSISITAPSPFTVINSTVSIFLSGSNEFTSISSHRSAIDCSDFSNVSLYSSQIGFLTVLGGSAAPGIGPSVNHKCNRILISGGSLTVKGGIGIGVGDSSSIGNLTIANATVSATGLRGAGVGSTGIQSRVDSVSILNATTIAIGSPAVGASHGSGITDLRIENGKLFVDSIGSVY
jgi:hypothetical protein